MTCDRCGHVIKDHRQAGELGGCRKYGCACRRTQWFLVKRDRVAKDAAPVELLREAAAGWEPGGGPFEVPLVTVNRIINFLSEESR